MMLITTPRAAYPNLPTAMTHFFIPALNVAKWSCA
jgi:hypothetical protein